MGNKNCTYCSIRCDDIVTDTVHQSTAKTMTFKPMTIQKQASLDQSVCSIDKNLRLNQSQPDPQVDLITHKLINPELFESELIDKH